MGLSTASHLLTTSEKERRTMLILSRKHQESVIIGCSNSDQYLIKVTVIEIRGNRVKLGFEAAEEIPIHRLELWERRHPGDPSDEPLSVNVAGNRAMSRWEDDGGMALQKCATPIQ